jgi:hypothetical protein
MQKQICTSIDTINNTSQHAHKTLTRQLLAEKSEQREEFAIKKDDIAFIVHQAWNESFA